MTTFESGTKSGVVYETSAIENNETHAFPHIRRQRFPYGTSAKVLLAAHLARLEEAQRQGERFLRTQSLKESFAFHDRFHSIAAAHKRRTGYLTGDHVRRVPVRNRQAFVERLAQELDALAAADRATMSPATAIT